MDEMLLSDWFPCLVVAMEREELERRRNYWGEPDEYVPYFAPELGPSVDVFRLPGSSGAEAAVARKILDTAGALKVPQHKHSVAALAEVRPDKARAVFLNEQGKVVDAQGQPVAVPAGTVVVDAQGQVVGPSAAAARSPIVTIESVMAMFGIRK